jgi:hypothetical protein
MTWVQNWRAFYVSVSELKSLRNLNVHSFQTDSIRAIKGIVSRNSVSTDTIGPYFRPKEYATYQFYPWKFARQKVLTHQYSRCKMAGAWIHCLVKFRAQISAADCCNPRCLDCGLLIIKYTYCGMPQTDISIWERIATGLTWPNVFLANRARSLAL